VTYFLKFMNSKLLSSLHIKNRFMQGADSAAEIGPSLLNGQALAIWKEALKLDSPAATDVSF
jgi:hypothetical protein